VVTSFLLLGIVVGPEGLDLMNASVIGSLRLIEPIALGMITFAAGEQLHLADIRVLRKPHYAAIVLETILPALLVGTGAWLVTGRLEIALPAGAIAGSTGLATVMSTLKESDPRGTYPKLLGFAIALDNFFAILAFSLPPPSSCRGDGDVPAPRIRGDGAVGPEWSSRNCFRPGVRRAVLAIFWKTPTLPGRFRC
jgi:Kef-type K+ transport system membrane component KefB